MQTESSHVDHCHHVRVDSSGRIRLPLELREKLGIESGDSVVVFEDDDEVRLQSAAMALTQAQEYFASFVPAGVSLADELIAERRKEAERE